MANMGMAGDAGNMGADGKQAIGQGVRLGIGSYTYAWAVGVPGYPVKQPCTAWDLLERAQELGVGVVQIADNLPLDLLGAAARRSLRQAADERDVQIEVGTRGIQPDHLIPYLEIAQEFSSPILRVVIDKGDHQPRPDEVVATLRPLLPDFEAAQVVLAIENHDRFAVEVLAAMLQTLDSPWVGICLDTVNSFGALEGPQVVVPALAPWTVNLHVKDFVVARAEHMMGFHVTGSPAGEGRLDIQGLLGTLAAHGTSRAVNPLSAIIELWTPPGSGREPPLALEAEWAARSVANLRRWIAG